MADRSISVRVTAVVSDFQRAMGQASATTKQFSQDVAGMARSYSSEMTTVGLAAGAAGAAIAGALGAGVKAAIDWESAFAGVVKTVDATDAELGVLEQGLRDLALEIPVSQQELAGIAEAAGQLGIETGNILSFTETMAALGSTTNLTSEQAATAFARFANITQLPQDQIENLGSTVVDLGNNLATTEAEIIEMGLRIAGAGSQIGLTEAEILGFAGALSSVGIEAQAGGTAISRVFVEIDKSVRSGGDTLDEFARVAGMSAEEFRRAYEDDAAGAIVTFIEGLGGISQTGGDVFGVLEDLELQDIRVRDALLRAAGAGDKFRNAIDRGSSAFEDNTALAREAELRYATVESSIIKAKNAVVEMAIGVGEILLPVLVPLLEHGAELVRWFSELPTPVKTVAVGLAGVSAVLLTVAGTALILAPRIIALVDAWKKLSGAMAASKALGATGMLPTPTVGGGGGLGGAAASTAVKGLAVAGAGFAVKEAVDAGVQLKRDIDSGNQTLAAQIAELMGQANRGNEDAAQRLRDFRAEFIDNADWFSQNVNIMSEEFIANRAWLTAVEMLGEGEAAVSEFNEGFRGGPQYAGNWASAMETAGGATDDYRQTLEEAREAQRLLVQGMNVAFGEVGSAIQAVQSMQEAQVNLDQVMADSESTAEDVANAQFNYASSVYAAQEAIDNMSAEALTATIDGLAQALGISEEEAYNLLEALDLLDGKEVTSIINVKTRQGRFEAGVAATPRGYGGGRHAGGPVAGHSAYRAGEGNRPELLATDSGLYVVPGDAGRVFSNMQSEQLMSALSNLGRQGGSTSVSMTMFWPQGERVESGIRKGLARASFLRAAS